MIAANELVHDVEGLLEAAMIRLTAVAFASAVILGIAPPVSSHHSHAMFDTSREVTVTGTVSGL